VGVWGFESSSNGDPGFSEGEGKEGVVRDGTKGRDDWGSVSEVSVQGELLDDGERERRQSRSTFFRVPLVNGEISMLEHSSMGEVLVLSVCKCFLAAAEAMGFSNFWQDRREEAVVKDEILSRAGSRGFKAVGNEGGALSLIYVAVKYFETKNGGRDVVVTGWW
jgi:hypothetical protein